MSMDVSAIKNQISQLKNINVSGLSKDGKKVSGNDLKGAGVANTSSIFSITGSQTLGVSDAQADIDKKIEDLQSQMQQEQAKTKADKKDGNQQDQQGQKKLDLVG